MIPKATLPFASPLVKSQFGTTWLHLEAVEEAANPSTTSGNHVVELPLEQAWKYNALPPRSREVCPSECGQSERDFSGGYRQPQLPLSGYRDEQFRLFPLDVGLLAAQAGLASAVLVEKSAVFGQFKGALTEQYVFQQLLAECGQQPYFWLAEKAQAEIDFLLETEQGVVPLEAKAELNLRPARRESAQLLQTL